MLSIVIPNYNGRDVLPRFLPSVLEAARVDGDAEVVVVDDASPDDSIDILEADFPSVRLVALEKNRGFSGACLEGVREARGDIVILLNSDVRVAPDFIAPLREDMADESVFAVSATDQLILRDGAPYELNWFGLRRGFLTVVRPLKQDLPPFETAYACGGSAAYRRSMFLQLGGFDLLYEPFYWEDMDIGYAAWKRGWRSLVDPRSRIWHEHERGSIAKTHGMRKASRAYRRNKFLFSWKNLTSNSTLLLRHVVPLVLQVLTRWMILDFSFYCALGAALQRLPLALARRKAEKAAQVITDRRLLKHRFGDDLTTGAAPRRPPEKKPPGAAAGPRGLS